MHSTVLSQGDIVTACINTGGNIMSSHILEVNKKILLTYLIFGLILVLWQIQQPIPPLCLGKNKCNYSQYRAFLKLGVNTEWFLKLPKIYKGFLSSFWAPEEVLFFLWQKTMIVHTIVFKCERNVIFVITLFCV